MSKPSSLTLANRYQEGEVVADLLDTVVEAHGGLKRWNELETVIATVGEYYKLRIAAPGSSTAASRSALLELHASSRPSFGPYLRCAEQLSQPVQACGREPSAPEQPNLCCQSLAVDRRLCKYRTAGRRAFSREMPITQRHTISRHHLEANPRCSAAWTGLLEARGSLVEVLVEAASRGGTGYIMLELARYVADADVSAASE